MCDTNGIINTKNIRFHYLPYTLFHNVDSFAIMIANDEVATMNPASDEVLSLETMVTIPQIITLFGNHEASREACLVRLSFLIENEDLDERL